MRARSSRAFPPLTLAPEPGLPIARQVASALRRAVVARQLAPGTRLPSTRELARELGVSRNTILDAYGQLLSEGYLDGRPGAGTFVAAVLPPLTSAGAAQPAEPRAARLSARGGIIVGSFASVSDDLLRPFNPGLPAVDRRLIDAWWRASSRARHLAASELQTYSDAAGYAPLRRAIAGYVAASRGVRCAPSQVIVCAGAQLAIASAARLLLDPGDRAWIEDPGYSGARAAIAAAGAAVVPVRVDDEGIDVASAIRSAPDARLVYATPSHQYPLAVTMSVARREQLLAWAAQSDAWILEDDYDAEFRFGGQPLPALQGLDRGGRVLYIGTFSKVLFPGLRLAYLIVPEALVESFTTAHAVQGYRPPALEQIVLSEFIDSGQFARHLRRMRQRYDEARETLEETVRDRLDGALAIQGVRVGLHVIGRLTGGDSDVAISKRAAAFDVSVPPLSAYCTLAPPFEGLVLGYGHLDVRGIRVGVQRLAMAIEAQRRQSTRPVDGVPRSDTV